MRARKPWVWCDCGAPCRSAANAASASRGRGAVALEHSDLVAGPAERERGGEPADAASDDHDPQRDVALRPRLPRPDGGGPGAVPDPHHLETTVARTLGYGNTRCQPLPLTRRTTDARRHAAERRGRGPTAARWAGAARERRAERRTLLVDAAFDLLGTEGWAGTTVRAVCQAARLNPRYFYESFDDLDLLVVAVYDRLVAELRRRLSAVDAAGADPPSRPGRPSTAPSAFVDDDRRRARVLYVEALGNEALNRRRIETGHALVAAVEQHAIDRHGPPPPGEQIGRSAPRCWSAASVSCAGVARGPIESAVTSWSTTRRHCSSPSARPPPPSPPGGSGPTRA